MTLVRHRVWYAALVALLFSYVFAPAIASSATRPGNVIRKAGSATTATIVNLGALLGPSVRFVPTAINERGQIVGYDDRTLSNGNAGAGYLLDPDGTVGALDGTGTTASFFIPLAVSANGNSVAGETNTPTVGSYQSGPAQWRALASARSQKIYSHDATPSEYYLPAVTGIADGNVPVGGADFYGSVGYSVTPFKTTGCTLTNFSALAANGGGTIVGSAGGYAATDTLSGCAAFVPGLPRLARTVSSAVAENASGTLVELIEGPATSAFGAFYLITRGAYARIPLPPSFSSATYFVQTAKLSDGNTVVGNVSYQAPPFGPVAPYLFSNGRSSDVNALLPAHSGWRLVTASGINSAGTIVGTGYLNGVLQGYALHP